MKVGDKVYCIKDNNGHSIGCTYVVLQINKNEITLNVDNGTIGTITDPKLFSVVYVVSSRTYYLYNPINKFSYFYDYFVGVREHRRLKLKKIGMSDGLQSYWD
jgi:hypothetical protein